MPKNIRTTHMTHTLALHEVMASDLEEDVYPCLGFWASNVQWEILRQGMGQIMGDFSQQRIGINNSKEWGSIGNNGSPAKNGSVMLTINVT